MTAHPASTPPGAREGADPVWAELRAVKAPNEPYTWHLEGRDNPESDPADPESWGWVGDISGIEVAWGHEPGETARLLAARWNAHAPLVAALAATDCYFCGRQIGEPGTTLPCPRCADARSALLLAGGGDHA